MNLFNLFATITADTSDYKKAVNDAEKDIEDLEQETEKSTNNMESSWSDLGSKVGKTVGTLATGFAGVVGGMTGLALGTEESREQMTLLETTFQNSGHSAEVAHDTYKDFYALLGDQGQAVEAVAFLAKMTDSQEGLAEWTRISNGLYSEFGASLPIESLAEAANETANTGAVTGTLADALNWAGISEEKFNEQLESLGTEQERLDLITSTLSGTYGDLGDTYAKNNEEVIASREAQVDFANSMNELGSAVAPVVTQLTSLVAEWLPKLLEFVQENEGAITALAIALGVAYTAFQAITIVQTLVGMFKAYKLANEGATVAQWLLNAAMNANPIVLIVSLIAGLVAAIIYLWNTNEDFRNAVMDIFGAISSFITSVVDWIVEKFDMLVAFFNDVLVPAFQTTVDFVKNLFTGLYDSLMFIIDNIIALFQFYIDFMVMIFQVQINNVVSIITSLFDAFKQNIDNIFGGIKQTFQGLIDFVTGVFTGNWEQAWNGVKNIFAGVFNTLTGIAKAPINGVIGLINGMIGGINGAIRGINSISVDIPDWVPGVGGSTFGANLSELGEIPYLATGDVAKPNNEYLAVLGDNKREEEVVSPLSTMKKAFNEELSNVDLNTSYVGNNSILEMLKQIKTLLENQSIYLDGKTLVGGIINNVDTALGKIGKTKMRGV